jgi:predicted Zn-dependent protease
MLLTHDEGELAGMLAHALAHASLRHGYRSGAATVPAFFVTDRESAPVPLSYISYVRDEEMEADLLAVRLLAGAGFDPAALRRFIERQQPEPAGRSDSWPPKAQRLAALGEAVAALPARTYVESGEFTTVQGEARRLLDPPRRPPTLRNSN